MLSSLSAAVWISASVISAILVGETLMRAPDIGLAVEQLLGLAPEPT